MKKLECYIKILFLPYPKNRWWKSRLNLINQGLI